MKKIILPIFLIIIFINPVYSKDNWELDIHYSYWSINILKSVIEENFTPEFENYDPEKGKFNFNSNGNNFGFSMRFFPKGKNGSFSIGFSYERNNFKAKIDGTYQDTNDDGYVIDVSGNGNFELLPHSMNFNIRWELWPTARVHPYLGIGLGIGLLHGKFDLNARVITHYPDRDQVEEFTEEMTIEEAIEKIEAEEGEGFPLTFVPIVHICFGFRGEVVKNLYLTGEVALYNGIILRGGLAFRF